jgi:hypothetical protein
MGAYQKAKEGKLVTQAYIADIAAKVENDQQESARKLVRAHDLSTRMVRQVGDKTALQGASENQQGDDCHGFFTISDNVLIVGESASNEEPAGQPHPH